jgi:membrane protein YqaA with SNARE-associated domain
VGWAHRPGGPWALFGLAAAEAVVFPVPPDVLLIPLCLGAPPRALRFALICSVGSLAGGVAGWAVGYGAWHVAQHVFIPWVVSQAAFDRVRALYHDNAFLAILAAAFTPIPYKVFTVAAGVLGVPLATLVVASALGRPARFYLVAGAIYLFGPRVQALIDRYFDLLTWLLLGLAVAGFLTLRYAR